MSEPATPQHVGCCSLGLGGEAWDVELSGGYAYVADGEAGLGIVDVTNPAAPVLVGTGEMSGVRGVDVVGGGDRELRLHRYLQRAHLDEPADLRCVRARSAGRGRSERHL